MDPMLRVDGDASAAGSLTDTDSPPTGKVMNQARIRYLFNRSPNRGLAVAGIFGIRAVMAMPHFIIAGALQSLALIAGYIGFFVVAFTGAMPSAVREFVTVYVRWWTRTVGWYTGVTDLYPPFVAEPEDYLPDIAAPDDGSPSRRWAWAGILGIKALAAVPHLVLIALLNVGVMIASWIGFFITAATGSLPLPLQDLYIGTTQWTVRLYTWLLGLTDEYPPFDLLVHPLDYAGE
jgi:hypothetical protein